MTELTNQSSHAAAIVGDATKPTLIFPSIIAAAAITEEQPLLGTISCCHGDGKEYSEGDAANLQQLASPSLLTWRERLYQFQENENFWTELLAISWETVCLQITYRLSVDIPRTPKGQEFLLPLCRHINTRQESQKTLNPAKIQDTSNVIQSNQVVAIQSITEGKNTTITTTTTTSDISDVDILRDMAIVSVR